MKYLPNKQALPVFFILAMASPAWAQGYIEGLVRDLTDPDPKARESAAYTLGKKGENARSAIEPLIGLLNDSNAAVRTAAAEALKNITKIEKDLGADKTAWENWWEKEGKQRFMTAGHFPSRQEVDQLRKDLENQKSNINLVVMLIAIVGIIYLAVILYFTAAGSSRLKMWKETIKQADSYIKESAQITKRTDRILDELESKKNEILEFFSKLREDKEAEIERFSELMQQNMEHRLREVEMGLRGKAEKEIEQTLTEMKAQVDYEIKKTGMELRDHIEKEFKLREGDFVKEAQAQTLFLEASFYSMNGKYEDALKLYKKLIALKPAHYLAWNNMGTIHRDQARYDRALEAYQKALELSPDNPTVLYNVAAMYARMRRKDKMIETLGRAFQNDGEYKDEALNDPAFKEYWSDPAFRDLAEV